MKSAGFIRVIQLISASDVFTLNYLGYEFIFFFLYTLTKYTVMRKIIYPYYEGHLESKERFAIKKYLLIIGKKKNMQVLSHTFTYFST